jgi:Ca-activated chloride channel family protein
MRKRAAYGKWAATILCAVFFAGLGVGPAGASDAGELTIIEPDGKPAAACPLEHTSVKAEVSGFTARVSVTQIFRNPMEKKIEAVYTFPLSADGAVDSMVMRVGDRVVRGVIKRREEARRIYENARKRGHTASLLDQERPNIFTQHVANIMPGQKVEITIQYVELLPYDDGAFRFAFPMVVGPRFIPGRPAGKRGTGWARDTTAVPDASRITPPVAAEGTRAGHDIDLTVSIDAGTPIRKITSLLHEIDIARKGGNRAVVSLKNKKEIPNRDFVLRYLVAGDEIRSGVLTHKDGKEGYVTVIMIPPKRVKPERIAPKEMIFVIDCSGSQRGRPLRKAKETMKYVIDHMNPDDTFNIIDFNHGTRMLFSEPKKNTPETRAKAHKYLASLAARGGTWMGPAVRKIFETPAPENRLRIVTFMTDGYVGNDFEIIGLVKKLRGKSRWFPFGTGNSVNRFLLDNMARVGGGEVAYILLNSPGEQVAKKFYDRISTPVLTDIRLSVEGITLEDVFPGEVSDLWDRKPLIFKARYSSPGKGRITIKGFRGGKPYEQTLNVVLPEKEKANSALGSLWARAKVDDLMDRDLMGVQQGKLNKEIREEIIKTALAHDIMTQFTSFVAVEETVVTVGGEPTRVTVPVEMPDGVSREGVFGASKGNRAPRQARPEPAAKGGLLSKMTGAMSKIGRSLSFSGSAPQGMPHAGEPMKDKRSLDEADKEEAESRKIRPRAAKGHLAKLSPRLRALVSLKTKTGDFRHGKIVVKDGKVTVQVWIEGLTDEMVVKLEKAGLKITFKASTGKTVIGSVEIAKLEDLVRLPFVKLIHPVPVSRRTAGARTCGFQTGMSDSR